MTNNKLDWRYVLFIAVIFLLPAGIVLGPLFLGLDWWERLKERKED